MLPSQPEQAKAMHTLRSGRKVDNGIHYRPYDDDDKEDMPSQEGNDIPFRERKQGNEDVLDNVPIAMPGAMPLNTPRRHNQEPSKGHWEQEEGPCQAEKPNHAVSLPFPKAFRKGKGNASDRFDDLYSMLSKVQINLPLLELIINVPAYSKFFKEFCARMKKFNMKEKVLASEVVNYVLQ